ncbi:hypothetical protein L838_1091 [Mycobacterium avium MAV_120709_2344]|nr:hypothetical protein L839_3521 [Mycobacterium avium MAV_120809_2495]ETZ55095.1 hypothetical protein L838_1091 [Mycobacterium avium MAV_120709_2344]
MQRNRFECLIIRPIGPRLAADSDVSNAHYGKRYRSSVGKRRPAPPLRLRWPPADTRPALHGEDAA